MAIEGGGWREISPEKQFEYEVIRGTRLFIAEVNKVICENQFVLAYSVVFGKGLSLEEKMERLEDLLESEEKDIELILEAGIKIYNDLTILWGHVFSGNRKDAQNEEGIVGNINAYKISKEGIEFRFTGEINKRFDDLKNLREKKHQTFLEEAKTQENSDLVFPETEIKDAIETAVDTALEEALERIKSVFPVTEDDMSKLRGPGFGAEAKTPTKSTSQKNTNARKGLRLIQGGKP